jgi:hypothetical protein
VKWQRGLMGSRSRSLIAASSFSPISMNPDTLITLNHLSSDVTNEESTAERVFAELKLSHDPDAASDASSCSVGVYSTRSLKRESHQAQGRDSTTRPRPCIGSSQIVWYLTSYHRCEPEVSHQVDVWRGLPTRQYEDGNIWHT